MTQLAASIASYFDIVPTNEPERKRRGRFVRFRIRWITPRCYLARSILSRASSKTLGLPLVQMTYPAPNTAAPMLDYPVPEPKLIIDHFLTLYKAPFRKLMSRSRYFIRTTAPSQTVAPVP
jgi:hypothetical protein